MGYMSCIGECVRCHKLFTFNPNLVLPMRWPPPDGPREPICRECVEDLPGSSDLRLGWVWFCK
jgi:hypothetical protein